MRQARLAALGLTAGPVDSTPVLTRKHLLIWVVPVSGALSNFYLLELTTEVRLIPHGALQQLFSMSELNLCALSKIRMTYGEDILRQGCCAELDELVRKERNSQSIFWGL